VHLAAGGKGENSKSGRKVRVHFRPNRGKPARLKDWTRQYQQADDDEPDALLQERVRAKGDLSRKRTIIESGDEPAAATEADQGNGVVLAVQGQIARVDDGQRMWDCTIRGVLRTRLIEERSPVAVGDRVRFTRIHEDEDVDQQGVIEAVAPRTGKLSRRYGDRVHTFVANVDQVVIVASVGVPPLKPHLIDRYIVAAEVGELRPVICINKIDLDEDGQVAPTLDVYRRLGYACVAASAAAGVGIDALHQQMAGRQSVIAGQSGVGKSSLLNALQPGLKLKIGDVSGATQKGRHTTATAELLRLDFGGYVVDTPGVRQFELPRMKLGELEQYFVEFVPLVAQCEYADCKHIPEESCAIKAAVEDGGVDPGRYDSYVRIFEELKQEFLADDR